MTKRTRTIIFLICLFLFILIAPSAVLYSQGYRIDFESKKISQTGGIFLKIFPKQAEVYLDGKLKKKTDFFFGSILIENLLPKKNKIEIKKEGYYPWKKTLEIKEREVTEAKNIVLFPQDINFNVLAQGAENFWFSPDRKKIILKEKEGSGWTLKLYNLDKNIKSHLTGEKNISSKGAELINLDFSEDLRKVYLEIRLKEQIKLFTLELDKTAPSLIEKEPLLPPVENAAAYQKLTNNDFYYLDNFGRLFRNGEQITAAAFPIKKEKNYSLEIFSNYVFLRENKNLYLFNPDSKSFEVFSEEINPLKISPDNKKLAYFSNNEIWILFLSDKNDQPRKKAGEKLFLTRLSEKINDVFWINSHYLVFNAGNKIKIGEIDDRDEINFVEIKNLPISTGEIKIFWNNSGKKLYILNEENLYESDTLLP